MLTPPLEMSASTIPRLVALRSVSSRSSSLSRMMPRSIASAPASSMRRNNILRFDSRIWPFCNGEPSSTSSSPVDMTPTRGRQYTDTLRALMLDRTPSTIGVTTTPGSNTTAPASTSDPASRIPLVTPTLFKMRTPSSPKRSVSSTMTIASQPSGMGAPVMMRIAVPSDTGICATAPAATSPITRRSTGT